MNLSSRSLKPRRDKETRFDVIKARRVDEHVTWVGRVLHLYAMRLDVVGAVGASSEVRQVELDLVPAAVEAHRQHAAERVNARRALIVAGAEPTSDVLVVEDLYRVRRARMFVEDS